MGKWKYSQEVYVRIWYKEKGPAGCQDFVDKSRKAIHYKANRLGITRKIPNWTPDEKMILLQSGPKLASRITGKSLNACKIQYSRLKQSL